LFTVKRLLVSLFASACLFLLAGCDLTVTNLSPSSLPANPSHIYTLSARATPKSQSIVPGSIGVNIIIDGKSHPMGKSALGSDIYEFDYQLPPDREELTYYFQVNYTVENKGRLHPREEYTG